MQVFDEAAVHEGLPYDKLIPALIEHHKRDVDARNSAILDEPTANPSATNNFLALPAWQHGRAIGAKLISVFPLNEKNGSGLPSVQGVYVLFDGRDGKPLATIDGTVLTLRKTAADSGIGSHFLARSDARRLLMVGAGAMAPHLIMAHIAARPTIQHVHIWNRSPARAEALAIDLKSPELAGIEIAATQDLETAARTADIISCATMATSPLIKGDWLKAGAHLDLVGSFRPDMHECDEAAIKLARVFVDSPWSAIEDCGEITSALASGALRLDQIQADNFSMARGEKEGRQSPDEITLYKNGGGGHLDLMVAQILCPITGAD